MRTAMAGSGKFVCYELMTSDLDAAEKFYRDIVGWTVKDAGMPMRYAVRPHRLDAAARSVASVAAQWDARLVAIKRIAEAAAHAQQDLHRQE